MEGAQLERAVNGVPIVADLELTRRSLVGDVQFCGEPDERGSLALVSSPVSPATGELPIDYQCKVPAAPLNGPTTDDVIHPP